MTPEFEKKAFGYLQKLQVGQSINLDKIATEHRDNFIEAGKLFIHDNNGVQFSDDYKRIYRFAENVKF